MKVAVIDCETIPAQNLPEGVMPEFDPDSLKLGNLKDPAKIEAKIAKERAIFNKGLVKNMSLHPDLCDIICFVGMLYDTETGKHEDTVAMTEPACIECSWQFITQAYHRFFPLVSYNGIGFDLPVLLHQAMIHSIPVSARMYGDLTRRYMKDHHYDLMQILAGWDRQRWEPLDFYLRRFGIGGKTGDGEQVYKLWKEGNLQAIEDYCTNDVLQTAKLFSRLEPWIVPGLGVENA